MNESQNKPEENIPGKEPEQIPQTESLLAGDYSAQNQASESLTTQPNKEMEVHHHGHVHEKKKWKEYLFQFLMLLLAIILGFQAENLREKLAERHMEKEYIESLVTDISTDYDLASRNAGSIFEQVKRIDTLQDLFFSIMENRPGTDSLVKKCYKMSAHINTFYSEFFNERTITQLLSSGNMRLIKKQGVADSIMGYHGYIKFVEVQKQTYINSINTVIQSMYNVYDIAFLKTILYNDTFYYPDPGRFEISLLTHEPGEIKKFIATLETTKIVAATYKDYLNGMMRESGKLYSFLKKKYELKE
jgi:hypothetical protein